MLNVVTALSYWFLLILWIAIFCLYLKELRRMKTLGSAVTIIIAILLIDAFRTAFESAYFGLYLNSLFGLLPSSYQEVLGKPEFIIIPKLLNIVSGLIILFLLILKLMPRTSHDIKHAKQVNKITGRVFDAASEGITITDPDGNIVEVNQAFTDITGYSREDLIGQNPKVLKSGKQSKEFYVEMWNTLLETGSWKGEIWNKRKNGEIYPEILTISSVHDSQGNVQNFIAMFSDITDIKQKQNELEYVAYHDALTNLPNRNYLSSILTNAVSLCKKESTSLAVLFFDLDGFKDINDKYGHLVGDELLIQVSNRLKNALRTTDTLARIGGDEFVAIIDNIKDVKECKRTLKRLVEAFDIPFVIKEHSLKVSVSIGATLYANDITSEEQLIRHADHAMYQAKQKGKNGFEIFDSAQASKIIRQNTLSQQIQLAVMNDEFVLHYQPKVDMKSGETIGVEALIRWQHPEHGFLLPDQFLPLIENTAIAIDIDDWVINTALKQISLWQTLGLSIPTSVNISAEKLQHSDFTTQLNSMLKQHPSVPSNLLQLEVLESTGLSDLKHISSVMSDCGVSFALDDFGTGYSSLTYLRKLPAELIKVDQSFVREMLKHQDDYLIVKSVVGLAQSFDKQVIAEGVETIEHGLALLEMGCTLAQGYAIAKPMAADQLCDWIMNWQPYYEWKNYNP